MKRGMKIYLVSGGFVDFPDGAESAGPVIDWFRTADDGHVITLKAGDKNIHLQKRAITQIEVDL